MTPVGTCTCTHTHNMSEERVTLRIELDIAEYDGSLLDVAPKESSPIFEVWSSLPNRQKNFFPIEWKDGTHKTKAVPQVVHTLCAIPAWAITEDGTVTVGLGETIGLRVKAHTPNKHGVLSIQDCGDVLIPLGTLVAGALEREEDSVERAAAHLRAQELPLELKYYVYSDEQGERVTKGLALVRGVRVFDNDTDEELRFDVERDEEGRVAAPTEFAFIAANQPVFSDVVQNMLVRSMLMFTEDAAANGFDFRPSTDESRRIHAPLFAMPSGLLPGFAYMLKPGALSPSRNDDERQFESVQAWYRTLCEYALARANRSPEWFERTVRSQLERTDNTYDDDFTECCGIVGQVAAIAPTSMPYVSDEVDLAARARLARIKTKNGYVSFTRSKGKPKAGVEHFSEEADNDGGDCEDGGTFAKRTLQTLGNGTWDDSLVEAAALVAAQYVPVVNLGSVKDASVGNDITDDSKLRSDDTIDSYRDKHQAYGAHMWCGAIPYGRFVAQVLLAVPDLPIDLLWSDRASQAPWVIAIPEMVIEATGRTGALPMPRISYVTSDDAQHSKKKEIIRRAERNRRVLHHLLVHMTALREMEMVRGQSKLYEAANERLTSFYRQTTYAYTSQFAERGLDVFSFVVAQRGARVPAVQSADRMYSGNSIAAALRAPSSDEYYDSEAQVERELLSIVDGFDADAHIDGSSASLHSGNRASESSAAAEAVKLLRPLSASAAAPAASANDFFYGVSLHDRLQSPLLPSTCLVPGPRVHAREMRVIAELLRHAPPMSMPGDWEQIEGMHAAALESLRLNGIDEVAAMQLEDQRFAELRTEIREAMGTIRGRSVVKEWPSRGPNKYELLTFFFPYSMLRKDGAVKQLAAQVKAQKGAGVLSFARLMSEEPMPRRRFGVLQFLCDADKV